MSSGIKIKTIIILIAVLITGSAIGLLIQAFFPEHMIVPQNASRTPENITMQNYTVVSLGKNVCEVCHLSGKPYVPQADRIIQHVNGGAYCLKCHKISHQVHPINNNVTCKNCHGTSPDLLVPQDGNISCNNCHNYPDSLKPSNGNLITIHRPRNVDCNRCHTYTCTSCHSEVLSNAKWQKRMNHFDIMLK